MGDGTQLWFPERAPARPDPRRPSHGASTLLIVISVAAVVTGAGVGLAVAPGSGPIRHAGQVTPPTAAHAPAPPVTVLLPPAPSTTTTTGASPGPSPGTGASGASRPTSSGSSSSYARRVLPSVAVGSGQPTNLTDPSTVATVQVPSLPLSPAPGEPPVQSLANPNYLGATVALLVTGFQGDWVQAYVPIRPNETVAWFPAADVSISDAPCHIAIGIGAHKLVLYCNNAPVYETTVATGAPSSPTPTGSFFVAYIVKLTDPGDAYGPYALGTSAFSNTYFSFEGGPGQVGIHGTNQPWVIGGYASHGCVRLTNDAITTLAQAVVPGTPVEIAS